MLTTPNLRPWKVVVVALVALACVATPTTAPEHEVGLLQAGGGPPAAVASVLLKCAPLAAEQVQKHVDEAGGFIQVGPHLLVIPAGALQRKTRISAQILADSTSSVRFGPAGLTFQRPATLRLSYAHCEGSAAHALVARRVVYTSDALQILKTLPTADQKSDQVVVAPIDHFSRYAVAW